VNSETTDIKVGLRETLRELLDRHGDLGFS
jgi:hypothetical protein